MQDCKEFQGELFGICNLFRDLSDKLFTSEIIELQEKQGQEHRRQEEFELNTYITPENEVNQSLLPGSKTGESRDLVRPTTSKPDLGDLGKFRFNYLFKNYFFYGDLCCFLLT